MAEHAKVVNLPIGLTEASSPVRLKSEAKAKRMQTPAGLSDATSTNDARPLSTGWQERHKRISGEIERVAQRLFAERGFSQVRVEDVATAVGCSVRTVTRYFPTKEALLLAGRRRINQRVLGAFEAVGPVGDAASTIWGTWMGLAHEAGPDLDDYLEWKRAASTAPEVMDRAEGERRRELQQVLTEIIARSLQTDPGSDLRPHIIAATLESAHGALIDFWVQQDGTGDLETLYRQVAEQLHIKLPPSDDHD